MHDSMFALSRKDNLTIICSTCGGREAAEQSRGLLIDVEALRWWQDRWFRPGRGPVRTPAGGLYVYGQTDFPAGVVSGSG